MSIAQDMSGRTVDPTLRLLANPELLQKRIDQLDAATVKAQAVIDRVGPIEDLEKVRAQADAELAKQKEVTKEAHEECERLIAEAGVSAAQIVSKATAEAAETVDSAHSVAKQAEAMSAGAKNVSAAANREREVVEARKSELDHKDTALQQRADALDIQEQELTGEKTRLADLRDLIQKAL